MPILSFLRRLVSGSSRRPLRRRRRSGRAASRFSFEPLENRTLLATFVVSDPGLEGPWRSFFTQISNANQNPGLDTIEFNLPADDLRLAAEFELPTITDPVIIDATTQPGYAGTPIIELDGRDAGFSQGLVIESANVTVRGLAIHSFLGHGLVLRAGGGSVIEGNYIGTDATGALDKGNGFSGINIFNSPGNTIGGASPEKRNVISGNTQDGITVSGAGSFGNIIIGNYIGTDAAGTQGPGTQGIGNGRMGVLITVDDFTGVAANNRIGGSVGERNVISGNGRDGIQIGFGASGNRVAGNYVGLAADGVTPVGNARHGVAIFDSPQNTVGGPTAPSGTPPGNVISGNFGSGVFIGVGTLGGGATGNKVLGNIIGLDFTGTSEVFNEGDGVLIRGSGGNTIGGSVFEGGNVISGNRQSGVSIAGLGATGNELFGNFIGTDARGTGDLGNGLDGVAIVDASGTVIGGTPEALRNVVSGNAGRGIVIQGADARANVLRGNFVGTDFVGTAPLGNVGDGVLIQNAPGTVVGGAGAGAGNIISGNDGNGLVIEGAQARGTLILQNTIGSGAAGTETLGNAKHGVVFRGDASDNRLGGTEDGAGNIIAHNGGELGRRGHGVVVESGTGNAIRHNRIFGNAGRGIDLVNAAKPDTFTLNDPQVLDDPNDEDSPANGDTDNGANGLQDYPVATAVQIVGAQQKIRWTLDSTPNSIFQIDFFASASEDPSGFGEAERFLFSVAVATDAKGLANTPVLTFSTNDRISATATNNITGDTSEFSMVDSDGDALADAWERVGIDLDEDGTPDYKLPGANPMRKDLYVELDAMLGLAPTLATLNRIEAAFAAAPLTNPDGSSGIALHITLDETIRREQWTTDLDGDGLDGIGEDRNGDGQLNPGEDIDFDLRLDPGDPDDQNAWPFFNRVKHGLVAGGGGFGTVAERGKPLEVAAKRLVSRYGIIADHWASPYSSPEIGTRLSISGKSEIKGNDFVVSLGLWDNTPDEQAGTFMHEFGHTLGLLHGGADSINKKPNYHSVMNYQWQTPKAWMDEDVNGNGRQDFDDRDGDGMQTVGEPFVEFDMNADGFFGDKLFSLVYSERPFTPLDENDLNETTGIGGHAGHWVPVGSRDRNVPESGAVDWSGDGLAGNNTGVKANINGGPGTKLIGHDDWSNLSYYFLEDPEFADGVTEDEGEADDEMDLDLFEELNAAGSGPGVLEFRMPSFEVGETAGTVEFTVRRGGGTLGAVSVDYATVNGTAVAGPGGDYAAASGTLSFAEGEYVKTFTVQVTADSLGERTESLRLVLSNPTGGAMLRDDSAATLNILDDDAVVRVVTNTGDSGPGSLRQAILDVNSHPGLDFIDFSIGTGVQTIAPLSSLPAITDPVVIDGTTQPGFAGNPIIELSGQSVTGFVEKHGLVVTAPQTTIRGLVINRFVDSGIRVTRAGTQLFDLAIEGNFIGTDVTGMQALGNASGVFVSFGAALRIGGTTPGARNVIAGNRVDGVTLRGGSKVNIQGNLIGLAADGATALGNGGDGVSIRPSQASGLTDPTIITIGGWQPGEGNVIAFNHQHGVQNELAGRNEFGDRYAVLSNTIYGNRRLGINLGQHNFADLNDVGTLDGRTSVSIIGNAAANPQNYPVLASAQSSGGQTTISGYLNSRPNETFLIQFFSNTAVEVSGFGQGETLLGSASVTTGGDGHAEFTVTIPVTVPDRRLITGTATHRFDNTSEFSRRLAVGDVLTSVYTVNTTDDVDDGVADAAHTSLREAIHAANNHPGPDLIRFSIGSGVQTIVPSIVPLPAVTDPVVIDGTTQPGYAGSPLIELSGIGIDPSHPSFVAGSSGLAIITNDSTVRGLVINRIIQSASEPHVLMSALLGIEGHRNVVEGNFIGTDVTGTQSMMSLSGLVVRGSGNRVGGTTPQARNVISVRFFPGSGFGVGLQSATATLVQGNFIGTDVTGTVALGNGRVPSEFGNRAGAILVGGANNVIGGAAAGAGNLIVGDGGDGIVITGPGTIVRGNFIGTDVTGTRVLGNSGFGHGIRAFESDVIGGTLPGEGNVIANSRVGIHVSFGTDIVIQGNFIGTDVTGTQDLGNTLDGIQLIQSFENQIGGIAPGAANVISGNARFGILMATRGSDTIGGNRIQGNRIGTQADGISPLGNGSHGIALASDVDLGSTGALPRDDLIGGPETGAGNTIAFNGGHGVSVLAGRGIGLLSNSIHSNGGLGIDLNGDGVTANDPGDADAGDNELQNFPVVTTAASDGVRTSVSGTINSRPNTTFLLQFFASPAADASGFGEGKTLLGSTSVTTDAAGNASFTLIFTAAVPANHFITATASDPTNNTSEFSLAVQVTGTIPTNQAPTASAGGPFIINEGDALAVDASSSSDPDGDPLSYSWDINGDGAFGDASGVTPTLTRQQLQALGIVDGPSSFSVRVRVNDGQGHEVDSPPTTVTVINVAPTADAGPDQTADEGALVTLSGSFTDPGAADTHTVNWHVVASNGQVIADGSDPTFEFVPHDNGTYTVTFTVTDDDGGAGSDTAIITVNNARPAAALAGPGSGTYGQTLSYAPSGDDPSSADDAAGFEYVIQWGDGTPDTIVPRTAGNASGASVVHTFAAAGQFSVQIISTDKDGDLSNVTTMPVTIGKAHLQVVGDNKSKVYGQANPPLTAAISGFVNGQTLDNSGVTGQPSFALVGDGVHVGDYVISVGLGTLNAANYDFPTAQLVNATLSVSPAPLSIRADDKSKPAGAVNPPLTFTPSGFVNGDTTSSLATQPTLTTTATTESPAGTYSITADGASSPNYTFSYLAGTLTVTSVVAGGTIRGIEYLDVTGNGLTVDDTPLAGVQVYLDTNNNGAFNAGEPATTSSGDGTYAFNGLAAGAYKVRQVVPAGHVRTAPALAEVYSVTLASGQTSSGKDFANAALGEKALVADIVYVINGTTAVSDLRDRTKEGDTIQVSFRVIAGAGPHRYTLVSYTAPGPTFDPDTAAQQEIFESDSGVFGPGSYTLNVTIPHSHYQVDFVYGSAIDRFGPPRSNIFYSAQNRLFNADNGGTHAARSNGGTLSGYVYYDANNNGQYTGEAERPISGVTVKLSGSATQTVVTDVDGKYTFDNLPAGAYTITEMQPASYTDGTDTLGTQGGSLLNDKFRDIHLPDGAPGANYNFGERQIVGSAIAGNQTGSTAFWKGASGQNLIKALNGGQNAKNLGNWLANNFDNLFGSDAGSSNNLAGKTNSQVASYVKTLTSNTSRKAEAEALALALNAYVTTSSLAGATATSYGFAVSPRGLGASSINVATAGAALGLDNNAVLTISELLLRLNLRSRQGLIWDLNANATLNPAESILRNQLNSFLTSTNQT